MSSYFCLYYPRLLVGSFCFLLVYPLLHSLLVLVHGLATVFSLIVPVLLVLFLLDMASPLSITLTMLMFLPGLLAISCHTFTFWLTELTEFILETILLFVIVLGGGGRGWLVLGTIWLLPGAVFSLFSTLQLLG